MQWVIGIVILVVVILIFSKGNSCGICNLPIKKKYYEWKIAGKKQKLCPKCNSQMERKVSKEAFKNKFS